MKRKMNDSLGDLSKFERVAAHGPQLLVLIIVVFAAVDGSRVDIF